MSNFPPSGLPYTLPLQEAGKAISIKVVDEKMQPIPNNGDRYIDNVDLIVTLNQLLLVIPYTVEGEPSCWVFPVTEEKNEYTIMLNFDDDGSGPFVVLLQDNPSNEEGSCYFDDEVRDRDYYKRFGLE